MAGRESQWFRVACVMVVGAVCLPSIGETLVKLQPELAGKAGGDTARVVWALFVMGAIAVAVSAAFALASWRATRPREREEAGRLVHALLGLQLFGCFAITVDLVHLVSAQAGATLPWRQAWRWQAGVMLLVLVIAVLAVMDGSFEPTTGLTHLPWGAQVGATVGNLLAWSWFAFAAGRMIVAERTRRRELGFANAELQATQNLLTQAARQGERLRIARELHDTLGHHLTGLAVNLELAGRLPEKEARQVIERSHLLSRLLLNDVRETVDTMRGEGADGGPVEIGEVLREMAAGVAGQQVHVETGGGRYAVEDAETAHTLVRCAQEALTNAMKHSAAKNIWVTLEAGETEHRLLVRDDGKGAAQLKSGNGLRGMRERVEALGGALEMEGGVPGGFTVRVRVPRREGNG